MTPVPPLRDAPVCVQRAHDFQRTGHKLVELEDEWYAVCFFYSTYHLLKAAFIEDPIFDQVIQLSRIDSHLALDDRYVTRHQGRIERSKRRSLGVNDIVALLYPTIAVCYRRLHRASVQVRYSSGLQDISTDAVTRYHQEIADAYSAGQLKAAPR
jgi:hypothetical protein